MARSHLSSATLRPELLLWGYGRYHKVLASWERCVSTANVCLESRWHAASRRIGEVGIPLSRIWLGKSRFLHDLRDKRAGHKRIVEMLWREFFADPSQWWDHRLIQDIQILSIRRLTSRFGLTVNRIRPG